MIMNMSAADNLRLGGRHPGARGGSCSPSCGPLLKRTAGLLSGGEQQMLPLARRSGREPEVLLADELSLGLAPLVVTRLLAAICAPRPTSVASGSSSSSSTSARRSRSRTAST